MYAAHQLATTSFPTHSVTGLPSVCSQQKICVVYVLESPDVKTWHVLPGSPVQYQYQGPAQHDVRRACISGSYILEHLVKTSTFNQKGKPYRAIISARRCLPSCHATTPSIGGGGHIPPHHKILVPPSQSISCWRCLVSLPYPRMLWNCTGAVLCTGRGKATALLHPSSLPSSLLLSLAFWALLNFLSATHCKPQTKICLASGGGGRDVRHPTTCITTTWS